VVASPVRTLPLLVVVAHSSLFVRSVVAVAVHGGGVSGLVIPQCPIPRRRRLSLSFIVSVSW
jgi:hypothetical protein